MPVKAVVRILGPVALALTVVPPILLVTGSVSEGAMKVWMLVGCGLWFLTAPCFMKGGGE